MKTFAEYHFFFYLLLRYVIVEMTDPNPPVYYKLCDENPLSSAVEWYNEDTLIA
jgi:hypothetical protein